MCFRRLQNKNPKTQSKLSIFRLRFDEAQTTVLKYDWTKWYYLMIIDSVGKLSKAFLSKFSLAAGGQKRT
jgi:hypothetical protein